mmetsp:Transcript_1192/g.3695  ORF Transcript_1192/g.3695 Transcript_1192/m.3695 type:complete len:268 (+) Transcript_1192:319-1122(+)
MARRPRARNLGRVVQVHGAEDVRAVGEGPGDGTGVLLQREWSLVRLAGGATGARRRKEDGHAAQQLLRLEEVDEFAAGCLCAAQHLVRGRVQFRLEDRVRGHVAGDAEHNEVGLAGEVSRRRILQRRPVDIGKGGIAAEGAGAGRAAGAGEAGHAGRQRGRVAAVGEQFVVRRRFLAAAHLRVVQAHLHGTPERKGPQAHRFAAEDPHVLAQQARRRRLRLHPRTGRPAGAGPRLVLATVRVLPRVRRAIAIVHLVTLVILALLVVL